MNNEEKEAITYYFKKVNRLCKKLREKNNASQNEVLLENDGILYALEYLFEFDENNGKCLGFNNLGIYELLAEKEKYNN